MDSFDDNISKQIVDETYWALCEGGLHSSRWNGSFITFTDIIMMITIIFILINMSTIMVMTIITITHGHDLSVTKRSTSSVTKINSKTLEKSPFQKNSNVDSKQ